MNEQLQQTPDLESLQLLLQTAINNLPHALQTAAIVDALSQDDQMRVKDIGIFAIRSSGRERAEELVRYKQAFIEAGVSPSAATAIVSHELDHALKWFPHQFLFMSGTVVCDSDNQVVAETAHVAGCIPLELEGPENINLTAPTIILSALSPEIPSAEDVGIALTQFAALGGNVNDLVFPPGTRAVNNVEAREAQSLGFFYPATE